MPSPTLLLIDDNLLDLEIISMVCEGLKCEVSIAKDGVEAIAMASEEAFTAIVSDYQMEPMDGIELVKVLKPIVVDASFVIITAFPDARVRDFTKDIDYCDLVTKPIQVKALMLALKKALGRKRGATGWMDTVAFSNRMDSCLALIGQSEAIRKVRTKLSNAMMSHASLLIEGPIGIGKMEIGRLIRNHGPYGRSHFVECSCSEMDEQELTEKLISVDGKWGSTLVEAVNGSLALYNIESLPLAFQKALAAEFSSMADSIYIIAQAHRSLEDAMNAGLFDMKLFFELSSHVVRLPPLSERLEDVESLVRYVVATPKRFGIKDSFTEYEIKKLSKEIEESTLTRNVDDLVIAVRRYDEERQLENS